MNNNNLFPEQKIQELQTLLRHKFIVNYKLNPHKQFNETVEDYIHDDIFNVMT